MKDAPPTGLRKPLPLLSRMAAELNTDEAMTTQTAVAMWSAYSAHTLLTGWALARRAIGLPVSDRWVRVAGTVLVVAGGALCVAGMSRFAGPSELTGTRNQQLTVNGIYRYSRNPQYLGYAAALAGAGLYRRSGAGLASAAALAAVYNEWIRVEEAHLTNLHGQDYLHYSSRTRRWFGTSTQGR